MPYLDYLNPNLIDALGQSLNEYRRLNSPNEFVGPPTPTISNQSNQSNLSDLVDKIYSQYPLQHSAMDALTQAVNQMPQRNTPSRMDNFMAFLGSLGTAQPAAYQNGAALGFKAGSPEEIVKAADMIRYRPY